MKDLELNILAEIDKNLPKMVATQLKERIENIEDLEKSLESARKNLSDIKKENEKLNQLVKTESELKQALESVKKREDTVFERERNADVEKLKHALMV